MSAPLGEMGGRIFYGVSGWRYAPWRGVFYPRGLAQRRELWYASRAFSSLEINGTFYSLQSAASFAAWEAEAPPGFLFSVKGPRFVTHMLKLRDCAPALANFFGSGVLALGEKLGPFLWQLPPQFGFREERLREFFAVLPRTTHEARALARKAERLEPFFPRAMPDLPLRHAIEIRHDTFLNPDFVALLREEGIALVLADTGGLYPYLEDVTGDFLYLRLHGPKELYSSGYDEASLRWWADRISLWAKGGEPRDAMKISSSPPPRRSRDVACTASRRSRDVYVYFDNDAKVNAPFDAAKLAALLGVGRAPGARAA